MERALVWVSICSSCSVMARAQGTVPGGNTARRGLMRAQGWPGSGDTTERVLGQGRVWVLQLKIHLTVSALERISWDFHSPASLDFNGNEGGASLCWAQADGGAGWRSVTAVVEASPIISAWSWVKLQTLPALLRWANALFSLCFMNFLNVCWCYMLLKSITSFTYFLCSGLNYFAAFFFLLFFFFLE